MPRRRCAGCDDLDDLLIAARPKSSQIDLATHRHIETLGPITWLKQHLSFIDANPYRVLTNACEPHLAETREHEALDETGCERLAA